MGRYYAMDRDNRWERVVKAYDAMVLGKGDYAKTAVEAVENSYKNEVVDEFVVLCVIDGAEPVCENSSVIFAMFRNSILQPL